MNTKQVLVVKVKAASNVDELATMRDYVIESVRKGVLVLDHCMAYSTEELPDVGAGAPVVISLRDDREALAASAKEEKQAILAKLSAYREANGVGCLNEVARKTKDKTVTADFLRLLLVGDVTASIATWRRIGAALRQLDTMPTETEAAE